MSLEEYRIASVIFVLGCYGISLLLCFFQLTHKQSKILIFALILINCVISANRPYISPDTSTYIRAFDESLIIANSSNLNGLRDIFFNREYYSMEMPFILLMALFKKLGLSIKVFFGAISFTTSLTTIIGLHNCSGYIIKERSVIRNTAATDTIMWYLYMAFCGILYTSTAIRAGLCIGLGLCAFGLIINNKKHILALLLFISAILFHSVGVLFIFIYMLFVLAPTKITRGHCIIAVGLSSVAYGLGLCTLTSVYAIKAAREILGIFKINAFSSYTYTLLFSFRLKILFYIVGVGTLLILSYKPGKNASRMAFLAIIGILIYSFGSEIGAIHRVSDYFILMLIPIMGTSLLEEREAVNFSSLSIMGSILIFISQYMMIFG